MAEYVFSGSPEQLRDAFKLLRLRAAQEKGTPFWLVPDDGSYRAQLGQLSILWTAQADGTSYVYVPDEPAVAEAWGHVLDFLLQRGWEVRTVTGREYTTAQDQYQDPRTIENPRHAKVIQLLIDRDLGRHRLTKEEMSKQTGYSRAQFYKIEQRYKMPKGGQAE